MNRIFYKKNGKPLTAEQISKAFNAIYDNPKHKVAFKPAEIMERIGGTLCDCYGEGEFVLLSVKECKELGKRYMVCTKCGEHSHL
jgi:hypothetical protein